MNFFRRYRPTFCEGFEGLDDNFEFETMEDLYSKDDLKGHSKPFTVERSHISEELHPSHAYIITDAEGLVVGFCKDNF